MVVETVCGQRGEQIGHQHGIRSLEIGPHLYGPLIFNEGTKVIQWGDG